MIITISHGSSFAQSIRYVLEQKKNKERDLEKDLAEKGAADRDAHGTRDGPHQGRSSGKDPLQGDREVEKKRGEPGESSHSRGTIIGGNATGTNRRELTREFNATRLLRTDVKKPVLQISGSAKHGEMSTDERKSKVAEALLQQLAKIYSEKTGRKIDFQNTVYVIISHPDTDHDHFHIVASRICFDGTLIPDSFERYLGQEVARELEKEFGLTRLLSSHEVTRKSLSRVELRRFLSEREQFERDVAAGRASTADEPPAPVKRRMQETVDLAAQSNPTLTQFFRRLQRAGCDPIPKLDDEGELVGMSYRLGDDVRRGSNLGRHYTAPGLIERGIDYDKNRDGRAISRAIEKEDRRRDQAGARGRGPRGAGQPSRDASRQDSGTPRSHRAESNPATTQRDRIHQAGLPARRGDDQALRGSGRATKQSGGDGSPDRGDAGGVRASSRTDARQTAEGGQRSVFADADKDHQRVQGISATDTRRLGDTARDGGVVPGDGRRVPQVGGAVQQALRGGERGDNEHSGDGQKATHRDEGHGLTDHGPNEGPVSQNVPETRRGADRSPAPPDRLRAVDGHYAQRLGEPAAEPLDDPEDDHGLRGSHSRNTHAGARKNSRTDERPGPYSPTVRELGLLPLDPPSRAGTEAAVEGSAAGARTEAENSRAYGEGESVSLRDRSSFSRLQRLTGVNAEAQQPLIERLGELTGINPRGRREAQIHEQQSLESRSDKPAVVRDERQEGSHATRDSRSEPQQQSKSGRGR